jgi:hypothetical protein
MGGYSEYFNPKDDIKAFFEQKLAGQQGGRIAVPQESSILSSCFYSAVEYHDTLSNKITCEMVVIPFERDKKSSDITYKIRHENENPIQKHPPHRLLDRLTKTTNPEANAWRKSARDIKLSLTVGKLFYFPAGINYRLSKDGLLNRLHFLTILKSNSTKINYIVDHRIGSITLDKRDFNTAIEIDLPIVDADTQDIEQLSDDCAELANKDIAVSFVDTELSPSNRKKGIDLICYLTERHSGRPIAQAFTQSGKDKIQQYAVKHNKEHVIKHEGDYPLLTSDDDVLSMSLKCRDAVQNNVELAFEDVSDIYKDIGLLCYLKNAKTNERYIQATNHNAIMKMDRFITAHNEQRLNSTKNLEPNTTDTHVKIEFDVYSAPLYEYTKAQLLELIDESERIVVRLHKKSIIAAEDEGIVINSEVMDAYPELKSMHQLTVDEFIEHYHDKAQGLLSFKGSENETLAREYFKKHQRARTTENQDKYIELAGDANALAKTYHSLSVDEPNALVRKTISDFLTLVQPKPPVEFGHDINVGSDVQTEIESTFSSKEDYGKTVSTFPYSF